jgi:hypothetical protein
MIWDDMIWYDVYVLWWWLNGRHVDDNYNGDCDPIHDHNDHYDNNDNEK